MKIASQKSHLSAKSRPPFTVHCFDPWVFLLITVGLSHSGSGLIKSIDCIGQGFPPFFLPSWKRKIGDTKNHWGHLLLSLQCKSPGRKALNFAYTRQSGFLVKPLDFARRVGNFALLPRDYHLNYVRIQSRQRRLNHGDLYETAQRARRPDSYNRLPTGLTCFRFRSSVYVGEAETYPDETFVSHILVQVSRVARIKAFSGKLISLAAKQNANADIEIIWILQTNDCDNLSRPSWNSSFDAAAFPRDHSPDHLLSQGMNIWPCVVILGFPSPCA